MGYSIVFGKKRDNLQLVNPLIGTASVAVSLGPASRHQWRLLTALRNDAQRRTVQLSLTGC